MIVAPFLATGSLNMVTAARGLGKTFFGMEMCKAVTLCQPFFEWQVPAARNVLFLDGEMPTEMLQERFLFLYEAESQTGFPSSPARPCGPRTSP